MRSIGRCLRAKPQRFTTLLVFSVALVVIALSLPQPFDSVLPTVAVLGLFVVTVASYTRNGAL